MAVRIASSILSGPGAGRRRRLLSSCAIAAGLAALMLGGPAHAQVQGTGQVVSGSATISPPTPGAPPNTTNVVTSTAQTVINWRPTDSATTGGPIDFLPAGNTLNFYGTGNYTVLNRFVGADVFGNPIPITRQIGLYGTVNSYIGSPFATAGNIQGGNIWFYNAGGILIGNTGVFNVGSLVLTANDIDFTGGLLSPSGQIRFRGAAGSTAGVEIASGASVNVAQADPGSAYMAVVAPRVVQNGFVSVDGSVAYVAAEQADVRINGGLFDINVLVGTSGGNAITHGGITTGPAAQDSDPNDSRIYLVAVPKNDAVTMLVSGQLGYQDPVTAQVEPNGAIRLSAGYEIAGGEIAGQVSSTPANIVVNDTIFRSDLIAHASGDLSAGPLAQIFAGGPTNFLPPPHLGRVQFRGSAELIGDNSVRVTAGNQQAIVASGGLTLTSGGRGPTPGSVVVDLIHNPAATGVPPVMAIGGALTIDVRRNGTAVGSDIGGGTARINLAGGTLAVGTDLMLFADANGLGNSADASGGTAEILVNGATSVLSANSIFVSADGRGGGTRYDPATQSTIVATTGGTGTGGSALLSIQNGGTVSAGQGVLLSANGVGGNASGQGGQGSGGTARISINGATSSLTTSFTSLGANGVGGGNTTSQLGTALDTERGGDARGGTVEIISNGQINGGVAQLNAGADGGSAAAGARRGGDATGGAINVLLSGGSAGFTDLTADTTARSGGGDSLNDGTSGASVGGAARVIADNASLTLTGTLQAYAAANTNQNATTTLSRQGGTVEVRAANGGTVTVPGTLIADASAGFNSGAGVATDFGSDANGGTITLAADGGTLALGAFDLNARAELLNGSVTNGNATGGGITLTAANGGQLNITTNSVSTADASAQAGSGPIGGTGTGGSVSLIANGGAINLSSASAPATSVFLSAGGVSGVSSTATPAGTGGGGTILLRTTATPGNSSALTFNSLSLDANGRASVIVEGGTAPGLVAGEAQGGAVTFDLAGGTVTGTDLSVTADGFGGSANGAGEDGGEGRGGTATLTLAPGATLTLASLFATANGNGGSSASGGVGGTGIGGTVTADLNGGSANIGSAYFGAGGLGGNGGLGIDQSASNGPVQPAGAGGQGVGGQVNVAMNDGLVTMGQIVLDATAFGGNGGDFDGFSGAPGDAGAGGSAIGGGATLTIAGGTLNSDGLFISADGRGGDGGTVFLSTGTGGTGKGGTGGNGNGGQATAVIAAPFAPAGTLHVSSLGAGGDGGFGVSGGDGGSGTGGEAAVVADNVDATGVNLAIDASGSGGPGASALHGAGGKGGDGSGGIARLSAIGPDGLAEVTENALVATGTGGNGGNANANPFDVLPTNGFVGGQGGNGAGGQIAIETNGGTVTLLTDSNGLVPLNSEGTGGNGGAGSSDTLHPTGVGGDGGDGGFGYGGSVTLTANGGTITSNGAPVEIAVGGTAGTGGSGGTGTQSNGAGGATGVTIGGNIYLGAIDSTDAPARLLLGPTNLVATGDIAGRIMLDSMGLISINGLSAEAFGTPINSDSDVSQALSGIFVSADGGRVDIFGDARMETSGPIGVFATGAGRMAVSGNADLFSGQTAEFRHTTPTAGTPTLAANGRLTIAASGDIVGNSASTLDAGGLLVLQSISGDVRVHALDAGAGTRVIATNGNVRVTGDLISSDDLVIAAGGGVTLARAAAGDDIDISGTTLVAARLEANGGGIDNEGNGGNISITTSGAAVVDHAEAQNDFTATVGSFRTGLNSVITGGDIDINAVGAVDMGNSSAGGHITINGQSIVFNSMTAGDWISLIATSFIDGGTATAANFIDATASTGNLDGSYTSGAVIRLRAGGNVDATIAANGGYIANSGPGAEGHGFVIAGGNATLTNSSAAGTIAVRSGGSTTLNSAVAGEDVYVSAGQTATLNGVTAGDNVDVTAAQGITATNVTATGLGRDDRRAALLPISPAVPILAFTLVAATSDGGDINLTSTGAGVTATTLDAADDINILAQGGGQQGPGIGTVTVNGARTRGIGATGGGSNISINGGTMALSGLNAFDDANITSSADIAFTGQSDAGRNFSASATGAITGGSISAGNDASVSAGTTVAMNSVVATGGTAQVGALQDVNVALVRAGTDAIVTSSTGAVTLGRIDAARDAAVTAAGNVTLTGLASAGRDLTVRGNAISYAYLTNGSGGATEAVTAGRSLNFQASQGITGGLARAGADLSLAAGGAIDIASATSVAGPLSLNGATGVTADSVNSGGTTTLLSSGGAILVGSLSSAGTIDARGDTIQIASGSGPLDFARLDTDVGNATVQASGGIIVRSSSVAGNAGLTTTSGDIQVVQMTATNVTLNSQGGLLLTNVIANDQIMADARGMAAIDGVVTAPRISVNSGDIAITGNGRIGTAGTTTSLNLSNSDSGSVTYVGGTGSRPGYHISADEMTRLFGRDIEIFGDEVAAAGGGSVGTAAPPDLIIDDFTITAGSPTANLAAGGTLSIATPGKARVIGDVRISGMTDDTRLAISGDEALEVILGEGSIVLTGSGTALGGQLLLSSEDIIVATSSAIADVAAATTMEDIDARLAQNDGVLLDQGALAAGGITFRAANGVYVQNSGAGDEYDERRGLSFGPLGLAIETGSAATRIVINGVHLGTSGAVTGLDTIPLVSINGATGALTGFDALSTVNGCLIVNVSACAVPDFETSFPVQDVVERDDDEDGDGGSNTLLAPLIVLRDIDKARDEPLLDDPVTGAGNDDLWTTPTP